MSSARHFFADATGEPGAHSALHTGRTRQSLDRRLDLRLLPDHRPGVLVALSVLAGGAGGRRSGGPLLASLVRPGFHGVRVLDVQDVATATC